MEKELLMDIARFSVFPYQELEYKRGYITLIKYVDPEYRGGTERGAMVGIKDQEGAGFYPSIVLSDWEFKRFLGSYHLTVPIHLVDKPVIAVRTPKDQGGVLTGLIPLYI
ncbi:hypothetical protein HY501_01675 [Candidatus Woesearchaeota archaeon]|nr:hypothetical protein [Candidatus Woesearchaeota archaeon]